jgi:hypothetical protein
VENSVGVLSEGDPIGLKSDVYIPSAFSMKHTEAKVSLVFVRFSCFLYMCVCVCSRACVCVCVCVCVRARVHVPVLMPLYVCLWFYVVYNMTYNSWSAHNASICVKEPYRNKISAAS